MIDQPQKERKPQYKVEVFKNNCWNHRVWRKNEYTAQTICEVESKSRHRPMRVIFEGKIVLYYNEGILDGKNVGRVVTVRRRRGSASKKGKKA